MRKREAGNNKGNSRSGFSTFNAILFFAVFVSLILAYTWSINQVNSLAVSVNELSIKIKDEIQKNDVARTEIEQLTSFERIKNESGQKLGLEADKSAREEQKAVVIPKSKIDTEK